MAAILKSYAWFSIFYCVWVLFQWLKLQRKTSSEKYVSDVGCILPWPVDHQQAWGIPWPLEEYLWSVKIPSCISQYSLGDNGSQKIYRFLYVILLVKQTLSKGHLKVKWAQISTMYDFCEWHVKLFLLTCTLQKYEIYTLTLFRHLIGK